MIVLPGPVLLADPLPDGWRRLDPAPRRDPAEIVVTVERLAAVAGHEVDVGAEVRCTCEAELAELDCPEHGAAALAWVRQYEPATMARLLAALREPAPPTRAERIEAAARAALAADDAIVALGLAEDIDEAALDEAYQDRIDAFAALRAALCSCTGHGPDLACVEHGEALRARMAEWTR